MVNCEWNQDANTVTSSTTFSELMGYLTNGISPILNLSLIQDGELRPNTIMISSPFYLDTSEGEERLICWSGLGLAFGCMENTGWSKIMM